MAVIKKGQTFQEYKDKKGTKDKQGTWHDLKKSVIDKIYADPQKCLADDNFMLNKIVDNGNNAAALCEALGYRRLTVTIGDKDYKLFCNSNHYGLSHYDMCFHPEKITNGKRQISSHTDPPEEDPLPKDTLHY